MKLAKKLLTLLFVCSVLFGMQIPVHAEMNGSQAIQLNPDNQNDQPFENQGMTGYIRFVVEWNIPVRKGIQAMMVQL